MPKSSNSNPSKLTAASKRRLSRTLKRSVECRNSVVLMVQPVVKPDTETSKHELQNDIG